MIRNIILLGCVLCILGCETGKGVLRDVANTTRNVADIFSAGKTIRDVTK